MKSKKTSRSVCAIAIIVAVVGTAVLAQSQRLRRPARHETGEKVDRTRSEAVDALEIPSLDNVSMIISETGRMEIAGIVRFEYTETGDMIVEARENGDFGTDPVLVLKVPLEVTDEGAVVTTAIQAIGHSGQNPTLILRTGIQGAVAAASGCQMKYDLDNRKKFCEGECPQHIPLCGWAIDPDNNNYLICACQTAPN